MKIEGISGNNIELTPAMEKYMHTRIKKLSKIVQRMPSATVRAEVGQPSLVPRKGENLFYAELNVTIQDQNFCARKTGSSEFKAMEKVGSDMFNQIMKWKKKARSAQRRDGAKIKKFLRSSYGE